MLEEKHLISHLCREIIPDVDQSLQTCLNAGCVLGLSGENLAHKIPKAPISFSFIYQRGT